MNGASYVDAYRSMRGGALYLIITFLLMSISAIIILLKILVTYYMHYYEKMSYTTGYEVPSFVKLLELVVPIPLTVLMSLIIVGGVIGAMGLSGRFVPGLRKLAELNPEFKTASTLVHVGLFWGTILMVTGAALSFVFVGLLIMVVAITLMTIGEIGLIMLGLKLYNVEKSGLYLMAGGLFVIGVFVPIASFLAWILLYVALGNSITRRAETIAPTTSLH